MDGKMRDAIHKALPRLAPLLAAHEGEVVERMICDTCSEETLENMKMGREGRGKSRAVARSAAKQAEKAQDTRYKVHQILDANQTDFFFQHTVQNSAQNKASWE